MTYYIYHIPGKKIGMTCDLENRVTEQQGYEPHEYEILEKTEDVDHASYVEKMLQESYGYKVDRIPYNKRSLDIVYERYREDFEKFNYKRIEKI